MRSGAKGHVGGTADIRLFVEAILYRFRAGIRWRDLPARFGYWKSVQQRFGRLGEAGFLGGFSNCWRATPVTNNLMIDATARPSTQRRRSKKDGDQAIGRSRGGLTTKTHALLDGR
jgi:transposase